MGHTSSLTIHGGIGPPAQSQPLYFPQGATSPRQKVSWADAIQHDPASELTFSSVTRAKRELRKARNRAAAERSRINRQEHVRRRWRLLLSCPPSSSSYTSLISHALPQIITIDLESHVADGIAARDTLMSSVARLEGLFRAHNAGDTLQAITLLSSIFPGGPPSDTQCLGDRIVEKDLCAFPEGDLSTLLADAPPSSGSSVPSDVGVLPDYQAYEANEAANDPSVRDNITACGASARMYSSSIGTRAEVTMQY